MIILGIDPAISRSGWGVISCLGNNLQYVASGVIDSDASESLSLRLGLISYHIEEIILTYKPDLVSMEEVFINKNPSSSLKLSHARGAIMSVIGRAKIQLAEFSPNRVKKTVVGAGKAEKEQVMHMINILMPQAKILRSDEADALAVAYTGWVYNTNR